MKVTNTSSVVMHVRGIEGVVPIAPGKTSKDAPTGLTAKHRGGGSYSIMDADGKEILSGMSKDDAEAYNVLSEEDKAAFVVNVDR
jgi:hypothetical protein